jgi:hypothetical protein
MTSQRRLRLVASMTLVSEMSSYTLIHPYRFGRANSTTGMPERG